MIDDTKPKSVANPLVDETKLNRMKLKIYSLEHRNETASPKMSDTEMREKIIKIIEEEAKKCN